MTDKNLMIIGNSEVIVKLNDSLMKIAPKNNHVLITGPTGTGKSVAAEIIHKMSGLTGKFITISYLDNEFVVSELFGHKKGSFTGADKDRIGAVPLANGGTLFLDEIGELALNVQKKLLHFLDSGDYSPLGSSEISKANVRLVFATNLNLWKEVEEGRFREDLYYRINVINLEMPSLSKRGDDVNLWIDSFFKKIAEKENYGNYSELKNEFLIKFTNYPWPGNLRELSHFIENTIALDCVPDIPYNINSSNLLAPIKPDNHNKKTVYTIEEDIFVFQNGIYNRLKHKFADKIFGLIKPGEINTEKAELLFMCPFIQTAVYANSEEKGSSLGLGDSSFTTWFHRLRNLNYLSEEGFDKNKGGSLPVGINLTYILRNLFIPQFYFLTVEKIKKRGVKKYHLNAIAEAAFILDVKQKTLQSVLRQHKNNQTKLTELSIW